MISVLLAALAVGFHQDSSSHIRFIVTGDDRWNTGHPRAGDENGVNVGGFSRVVKAMLDEKPNAVLINGDLVGGGETDAEETSQFDTWFKVMAPVYAAKITVLPIRGNHEMHCPHPDDVWKKAMSGPHAVPGTGDAINYTYNLGNIMFVGVDVVGKPAQVTSQAWLDGVLKKPHPAHVFTFAHKMAFFSGNHDDGMFTEPGPRDAFMNSLKDAGVRVVFFGHDHLYDHLSAKLPAWSDDQAIHQFVIGTAGAPFVKGKTLTTTDQNWALTRVKHAEQQLGYCVVDVDGPKVTIVYKSETSPQHFETIDTFSYTQTATSAR